MQAEADAMFDHSTMMLQRHITRGEGGWIAPMARVIWQMSCGSSGTHGRGSITHSAWVLQ